MSLRKAEALLCSGSAPLDFDIFLNECESRCFISYSSVCATTVLSEIISLLFAPAQDSCLVEQSVLLHFFLVDPLPLRDTRLSGSIRPAAAHHSILQNSRRMRKQPLILFTFCAEVKTYLRLMSCGFPGEPWGCSMHESLLNDSQ